MDSDTLPTLVLGACIMCGALWYGGQLLNEAPAGDGHSQMSRPAAVEVDSNAPDQGRRTLEADLVTAREEVEQRKRQLEWEKETAHIQHRARLRDEEYRDRVRQYEAEDRRREIEERHARHVEEMQQQRDAEELAKRRAIEDMLRRRPQQEQPEVLPVQIVPGHYVEPRHRSSERESEPNGSYEQR